MSSEKCYEIRESPEKPLEWSAYAEIVRREWSALLNKEPAPSEAEVQAFLELHPSLIPGSFGIIGSESGHCPAWCGVIRQAPLPSYNHRVPDFMWLSENSEEEQPVLIEIEAPSRRWFTASGDATATLNHALGQIAEWKAWFDVPHTVEAFKAFYGMDDWRGRRFHPAYVLIYGRRAELEDKPEFNAKRAQLFPDRVVGMGLVP